MYNGKLNKNLHILIIPSWYKTPETPVLGTFFEEQARSLQKQGHFVGIIYPEYTPPSEKIDYFEKKLYDFYMDKGIPTFNVKSSVGIPKFRKLSYNRFSNVVNRVYEDYEKNFGRPDVIHAHSAFHAGICGLYIAKTHNIQFIITEHLTSFLLGNISHKIDVSISRKIFMEANAALIVSNNFKKNLERKLELPKNTFKVVHNLVNDLFFESYEPKSYNEGEAFNFFTNSFLVPRKNIILLIDAIKILISKYPLVTLKICGEGPDEEPLKEHVKKLGIENCVFFTGKLFRQEVKQALDECHCFVLGSNYETFGVVLIESLACGRPVVTTNSGGPLDFITPEQGVVVGKHAAASMAEGMEFVMKNYDNYNQKNLIDYCREHFSEQKIATQLVNHYRDVLGKSKGANSLPSVKYETPARKNLLITFDYELFLGNRSGLVNECVIEPTYKLLTILNKYGVKAIFFVDTMYLHRLKQQAETVKACQVDFNSISSQLVKLVESGHYVFPHVHPHWLDAEYRQDQNQWYLQNIDRYRFHNLSDTEREYTFDNSMKVLSDILLPSFPDYKLDAFRAGGWCIQPFTDFISHFNKYNIRYEFSVMKDFYQFSKAQFFDFTDTPQEEIYPFSNDVCVVDANGSFYEYNISSLEIPRKLKLIDKVWLKIMFRLVNDHTLYKGEGQTSVSLPDIKPPLQLGNNLEDSPKERVAVELLTRIKYSKYCDFIDKYEYMHFVSHPKMIANHNLMVFDKFLNRVYRKYIVETDFRKMNPD